MRIGEAASARERSLDERLDLRDAHLDALLFPLAVPADDDAGPQAELGHGRPLVGLDDLHRDAEPLECGLDDVGAPAQIFALDVLLGAVLQDFGQGRQTPGLARGRR